MVNTFVDGEWQTSYEPTDDAGEFQRRETTFRDRIGEEFPAERGRYHLYVSYACPWAHRTLITRTLKGLEDTVEHSSTSPRSTTSREDADEQSSSSPRSASPHEDAVSVDVVDPYRDEDGWQFTPEKDGCTPDTVNGFDYLRESYVAADPDYTGRVTVPVLWDRETGTIVNNESKEIMRMLDVEFEGNGVSLYPEGYRDDVDRILEEMYGPINNGVYRAGFAGTQAAYDAAVGELFDALDRWDDVLADQRYLAGDRLTEADVAMFTTLVRFDQVYHTHFKCDRRFVHQYDHLWPYLRDLYQTNGFGETVRMDHIKEHYYTTHADLNPSGIVATGPDLDFEAPHDRDALPGERPAPVPSAE